MELSKRKRAAILILIVFAVFMAIHFFIFYSRNDFIQVFYILLYIFLPLFLIYALPVFNTSKKAVIGCILVPFFGSSFVYFFELAMLDKAGSFGKIYIEHIPYMFIVPYGLGWFAGIPMLIICYLYRSYPKFFGYPDVSPTFEKARMMKYFWINCIVTFSILVSILVAVPRYADRRSGAEVIEWLSKVVEIQSEIEKTAVKNKSLIGAGANIDTKMFQLTNLNLFEVTESSTIILHGGSEGQVVVLIPSLVEDHVVWRCVAGPKVVVPIKCSQTRDLSASELFLLRP